MERDDIDYWIHESERVVLLGEAAHPWVVRDLMCFTGQVYL